MASIRGVELKSIKYGADKDDFFAEASIYINRKKAGKVSLSKNINKLTYNWEKNIYKSDFENISEFYVLDYPNNIKSLKNTEILLNDLLELNEIEKEFKRVTKKGATTLALLTYNNRGTLEEEYDLINEDLLLSFNDWNNSIKKNLIKNYNPKEIKLYNNLNDFIIE